MIGSFRVEAWREDGCLATHRELADRGHKVERNHCSAAGVGDGSISLRAQTSLGTILGNVTDESGAAIPHVAVTITNEATSAPRT